MLKAFKHLTLILSTVTCLRHNFCDWRNCSHVICGFKENKLHNHIMASDSDIDSTKGVKLYPPTPYIVKTILSEVNKRRSMLACRRHQFLDPAERVLFIHSNMYAQVAPVTSDQVDFAVQQRVPTCVRDTFDLRTDWAVLSQLIK